MPPGTERRQRVCSFKYRICNVFTPFNHQHVQPEKLVRFKTHRSISSKTVGLISLCSALYMMRHQDGCDKKICWIIVTAIMEDGRKSRRTVEFSTTLNKAQNGNSPEMTTKLVCRFTIKRVTPALIAAEWLSGAQRRRECLFLEGTEVLCNFYRQLKDKWARKCLLEILGVPDALCRIAKPVLPLLSKYC